MSDEPRDEPLAADEVQSVERGREDDRSARPLELTFPAVTLALVVLVALATRVWLSFGPMGGIDSDEAVTGLIARRMLHDGEFPAFFWGQAYGGNLDALALAGPIKVFGTSTVVVKVFYLITGALMSVLTWRVARHLMASSQAIAAGVLSLLWPLAHVWKTTRVNAFYSTTVLLGFTAWLLVFHIDRHPSSYRHWAGFGFVLGIAWWVSPNIVYFAAPLSLWLVARGHWRRLRQIAIAAVSFAAGSFVWIVANLRSDFASLHVPDWSGSSTYLSRLGFLFQEGLPYAFGLRRPWDSKWLLGWPLSLLVYVALLGCIVLALSYSERGRRSDFLVLGLAPFLFAYFPGNWSLFEGRYMFFIAAVLPITFGRLWKPIGLKVGLAAVVTATAVAYIGSVSFLQGPGQESTAPMIDTLRTNGYSTAFAEYWIAYQMTFEAAETVIASPLDVARFEPYLETVRQGHPAYVFRKGRPATDYAWITDDLQALDIPYRIVEAGDLIAILPEEAWVP